MRLYGYFALLWGALTLSLTATAETSDRNGVRFCQGGDQALLLDYRQPASAEPTPAVVLVHGGYWLMGEREQLPWLVDRLAQAGFFVATIDYRLKTAFPGPLEDVKCAVRYLRSNAVALNIDPKRIALFGESAGAHLSVMASLTPGKYEGTGGHPGVSSAVAATVDWYGPTDLTTLYRYPSTAWAPRLFVLGDMLLIQAGLRRLLQGTPDSRPAAYAEASPLFRLHSRIPPLFIVHGGRDVIVDNNQSARLYRRGVAIGAPVQLLTLPQANHVFPDAADREEATNASIEFLRANLSR